MMSKWLAFIFIFKVSKSIKNMSGGNQIKLKLRKNGRLRGLGKNYICFNCDDELKSMLETCFF